MSLTETASVHATRSRASAAALKLRDDWLAAVNAMVAPFGIVVSVLMQKGGPLEGFSLFVVWDSDGGVVFFSSMKMLEVWLDDRWSVLTKGE